MTPFVADEDFNGAITRGLLRRGVDIVRVQDVGLRGAPDLHVLQWATEAQRVVLTHDHATPIGAAYQIVRANGTTSGVIAVA